ncbi:diguanylate cyclase/phosphodiesterase (GGDEF & EAL domains) with PAS/PAC sensor(s) [hydrothermal vent metagenome]|uniref:Diguanylate cyclase/phosphodiesterase (GGDEF & EAL domains) with PAS/PAC sensor(S) n=1 Tax=hydrothermal vent metagenome TaxID=652676 RepID=A0A1W1C1C4_9ZZZZ
MDYKEGDQLIIQEKGENDRDYFHLRKEIVVKVFLKIAFIVLTTFSIINIFYNTYSIALLDFLAALIALYTVKALKNKQTINLAIKISSFNIFFFFLLYVLFNGNTDNGLFWVMFVPIFLIPLHGYKKGTAISILFYVIVFIIAYFGIGEWQNGEWNFHSYIRFVASSSILLYVIYINEYAIYQTNLLLYKKEENEKRYIKKLQEFAELDYLTKIYNRRKISKLLEIEFKRSKRYKVGFCLAIVDIDYFKKINDTYGHNTGDEVLVGFTNIIKSSIRETDIFGRWGGEEFVIIFTHSTMQESYSKCEKIRQKIQESNFEGVHITCSIGIACYNDTIENTHELIAQADKALYKAKEMGRNMVQTEG